MADAREAGFAESLRQRANQIVTAVNEEIRKDLPQANRVLAAVGGIGGTLNALPKPRNELDNPVAELGEAGQAMDDVKAAIDDAIDGVCPALLPFSVSAYSVALKPGEAQSIVTSVPVIGGWVGGATVPGVALTPDTGPKGSTNVTSRGFTMIADAEGLTKGTYYLVLTSTEAGHAGTVPVKVRIDKDSLAKTCRVPKPAPKPMAPAGISADEPAAALSIDQVLYIQAKLKVAADGNFGSATRTAFAKAGYEVDSDGKPTLAGLRRILAGCSNLSLT